MRCSTLFSDRILAREFDWFEDEVILEVDHDGGRFLLRPTDGEQRPTLWCRREEQAEIQDGRLRIPLDAFRFHRGQSGELTGLAPSP